MQSQRDHLINRLPLCEGWLGSLKPFKKPHTVPDEKTVGPTIWEGASAETDASVFMIKNLIL